ncbi:hypothetical protein [Carboxylicivirga caseinilyticus]|uniref:hypothetical protein n=1 Tax=Carboxylicivirga caseinilyticus TaxID=3417572 RepID=UPI003D33E065|nr:hypothetical protein [Marinilabiliaceae bacterium A049]
MKKLSVVYFLICLCTIVDQSVLAQQKDVFMGGRIGLTLPTNISKPKDLNYGFKDMSRAGIQVAYFGRWFYMENLSLGWDLGYQYQSTADDYWNVSNWGEVNGSYQTIQLLAEGNIYFDSDEVRPYAGVAFGAFALLNRRTYSSNNEVAASSETYKYQKVMPGLAPQAGILFDLGGNVLLDIHTRLVFMPNLKDEYVTIDGSEISTNPHGAQNHLSLSIGLLF